MPPVPTPLHGLAPDCVNGPIDANAQHDDPWAAWQAHVDAGRIGERATAAPATPPEPSPA